MYTKILSYKDLTELSSKVAVYIAALSKDNIKEKGLYTMALSGGKTPGLLYETLTHSTLWWEKIHIFLVDERYVPYSDPLSNFSLVQKTLLSKISIPQHNVHPINTEISPPENAATLYADELKTFFEMRGNYPVFDLILLGIGEDGHTASLFPGRKHSEAENVLVKAVGPAPIDPKVPRITLTLGVINNAANIAFLVSGKNKAAIVKRVVEEKDTTLPAAMVKPHSGNLLFFLDKPASSKLSNTIKIF